MPKISLEILVADKCWQRIPHLRSRLQKAAEAAFMHLPKTLQIPCAITVLLTTNTAMRKLNRDFRGLDKPTNVLSFPQFTTRELTKKGKTGAHVYAGDIALGYQYMVVEAKKNHKMLINHAVHLLIHGILHIFGYDHQSDAGASRMESVERKVMSALGLPDPYAPQPKEPKAR